MGVPKKRHSKSKVGKRKMHYYLVPPSLVKCENCGKTKEPHTVCPFCGFYKGKKVLEVSKEKK